MKINYTLLKKLNACESGINKFVNTFGELEIPKGTKAITSTEYNSDIKWIADKLKLPNLIIKNGNEETYEYNDQGLEARFENSDGRWETYTYNERGLRTRYENIIDGIPKYDFTILLT